MLSLESKLTEIKGVGPTLNKQLGNLGLATVYDLLSHFPNRYEDFSTFVNINKLKVGERVTLRGKIQLINTRRSWKRRLTITEALIKDNTGSIKAVWFNQPYLANTIKPGSEVMLAGVLSAGNYGLQLEHPIIETATRSGIHTGRLVPIYPTNSQLTQKLIRNLIAQALPLTQAISDWLPTEITKKFNLPKLGIAIHNLHYPGSVQELKLARQRVTFDELFIIHLKNILARKNLEKYKSQIIPFANSTKELVSSLPWLLTNDQRQAAWEIIKDLGKSRPMYRLLQGDVGSGKTVVAGLACFNAVQAGLQTALLAPTEILAEQHWQTLTKILAPWSTTIGLLTSTHHQTNNQKNTSARELKEKIASGSVNLIIGTHALLQADIKFNNLALVVIDEQHRFGVEQRKALINNKSLAPHLLSMTATPIPRSLALTLYGDLDISIIKNLPAGRQPITTKIIDPAGRQAAYNFIKQEIDKGNRAFIICPLIEESDHLGVKAATTEYDRLQKEIFPGIKIGLLHGKLKSVEKNKVMVNFKNGQTPILVSTSVVEVGVDVPEATVIVIEGAERFGLAQLHQFRGRVGRSELPSYCLLMTDTATPRGLERLQAMTKFSNGFDLAEFDLNSRGPGDLLGQAQSGFLKLKFAELANAELLKMVREAAKLLISLDISLKRWPQILAKARQDSFHPE